MTQTIKTVPALRKAIKNGQRDFAIILAYGVISRKHITLDASGRFSIFNGIDGTCDVLSARELYTRSLTNIGYAMKHGAFVAE